VKAGKCPRGYFDYYYKLAKFKSLGPRLVCAKKIRRAYGDKYIPKCDGRIIKDRYKIKGVKRLDACRYKKTFTTSHKKMKCGRGDRYNALKGKVDNCTRMKNVIVFTNASLETVDMNKLEKQKH